MKQTVHCGSGKKVTKSIPLLIVRHSAGVDVLRVVTVDNSIWNCWVVGMCVLNSIELPKLPDGRTDLKSHQVFNESTLIPHILPNSCYHQTLNNCLPEVEETTGLKEEGELPPPEQGETMDLEKEEEMPPPEGGSTELREEGDPACSLGPKEQ